MINRKEKIYIILALLGASFLLYGNSLDGDFVSDDKLIILQNPLVSGDFTDFFKAFSNPYYYNQPHAGLYRPLTIASYNLNRVFSSGHFGFHLINVLLNAVNGFLVFLLVFRLTNKRTAYLAALLFMFLPIHSEAVSSIVGRAELLAFMFSMLSLLLVLDKRYIFASIMLFLGLLSKETAAGFFLVFLYLWRFSPVRTSGSQRDPTSNGISKRQIFKRIIINSSYFVPAVGIYAALRFHVLGRYFSSVDHLMAYNPLKFVPFFHSLWTSLKVFYLYILKTFVPYQLSSDYSFNQIPIIKNPFIQYEVYLGAVVLAGLIYLAVKKRYNIYGFSAAIFLLTYFLISNWVIKIGTIMGERLMYAPSLGLAMLIAAIMQNAKISGLAPQSEASNLKFKILDPTRKFYIPRKARDKFLIFTFLIVLAWYGYVIINRNRDWKNEPALFKTAHEASPNSVISLYNMAFLAFNDEKYSEAIEWTGKALEILPDHMPAIFLAGHAYKNLGDIQSAERNWLEVAELSPTYKPAYLSLGILYYEQGQLDEAEAVLEKGYGPKNPAEKLENYIKNIIKQEGRGY